jgi:hypothetical protein
MPLMLAAMMVVGASAAMILMYQVDMGTQGGNLTVNDFAFAVYETAPSGEVKSAQATNIDFPNIIQDDIEGAKYSDNYIVELYNPSIEVSVNWTFNSVLPTGYTSNLYVNTSGSLTLWPMGDYVVLGNGYGPSVAICWSLEADITASGGSSMDSVGITFKSFEDPTPPAIPALLAITEDAGTYDISSDAGMSPVITSYDFGSIMPGSGPVLGPEAYPGRNTDVLIQAAWSITEPALVTVTCERWDGGACPIMSFQELVPRRVCNFSYVIQPHWLEK